MPYPDYYKTLKLDRTASDEQIWLSYHKLEYLYSKGQLQGGVGSFLMADQAYRILSNPDAREAYDRWYEAWLRHQQNLKQYKSLAVVFFTSFLSAGFLSLFMDHNGRFQITSQAAFQVIFGILILMVLFFGNKLRTD